MKNNQNKQNNQNNQKEKNCGNKNCGGKNCKNRFKTHKKGSNARFCPFLSNGLESITCAAGKCSGIDNRKPCFYNIIKIRFFKNKHKNN